MASDINLEKTKVHETCVSFVKQKIQLSSEHLDDLISASANDTKSSAGDKFETSREMLQQEINKAEAHLSQLQAQLQHLNRLHPTQSSPSIELGSLVVTNVGTFYISASIGKIQIDGDFLFAISEASPMSQALLNNETRDQVIVNGREIIIEKVM